jgi:hypothetical protein
METLQENKKKVKDERSFAEIIATFRRLGYNVKESISKAYFEMYKSEYPDSRKNKKGEKDATRKRKSRKDAKGVLGECEAGNGLGKATEASSCHSL